MPLTEWNLSISRFTSDYADFPDGLRSNLISVYCDIRWGFTGDRKGSDLFAYRLQSVVE